MITKHTDLEKTCIKRDESDVASMVDILENNLETILPTS